MVYRVNRVNALNFIDVPEGIPVGAVIGRGGCQAKLLQTKHGVRCKADFNTRKVLLTGSREGVDGATRDIHELFDKWRADQNERARTREPTIHKIALVQQREHSAWRFETRDDENMAADPSVASYPYRLVETDTLSERGDDDQEDEAASNCWISAFDETFQQRIHDDVMGIRTGDPTSIKLKAAFGLQCFAIPDTRVARGDTLSWGELGALRMYSQIKPRWSNVLNQQSEVLVGLLEDLETRFDSSTTFKTELVVYVNQHNGSKTDVSVKFRWENDEWVVVERKPVRVAHALYNIALSNETAFRVRVYSRQEPPPSLQYEEIISGLEIATGSSWDPFTTVVTAGCSFPDNLYVRSFVVRETVNVEHCGLRFAISYMNATRTIASLACRLVDTGAMEPPEAIGLLLSGVLSFATKD